jgi:phosphoribosylaminoimidazolecarboxamide formyltransferase / IMP cyclohydrolase
MEKRIVVLASGSGTNFEAIVRRAKYSKFPLRVLGLITDNPQAYAIERAKNLGIPYKIVSDVGEELMEAIRSFGNVDAVVMAGFMRILPQRVIEEFRGKILNIHPSLLPSFKGLNAIERAWTSGVRFSGVTVHIATEKVDEGPILAQKVIPTFEGESLESFESRVHSVEHALYFDTIVEFLFKERPPYALITSYEKTAEILNFAKFLLERGYTIISTTGTANFLNENGVLAFDVSSITGFPEILGGRVKTLNPYVFAGILRREEDERILSWLKIPKIEIVFVQLYPFSEVAEKSDDLEEIIEMIDIGGVSLIRVGAKNFRRVLVLTDLDDIKAVMDEMERGEISEELRKKLAVKAFAKTASYDIKIYEVLASFLDRANFHKNIFIHISDPQPLRYGENPHQLAWIKKNPNSFLSAVEQLGGKELSYNNILDSFSAFSCVSEFENHACVIVKHMTPCAGAEGESPLEAYNKTLNGDMEASFGGIIAFNFAVEEELAQLLVEHFYEVVIATDYSQKALEILSKRRNLRILRVDPYKYQPPYLSMIMLGNDILIQTNDYTLPYDYIDYKVGNEEEGEREEIIFGLRTVKWAKSNAAVVVKNKTLLGTGSGLVDRVSAVKVALEKAGEKAKGGFLISDGFFPFADSIEVAKSYGIKVVVEPGGSIRDEVVIERAKELGLKLVFTGKRLFRH